MISHLDVAILVGALKVGRARVDHHQNHTADPFNFVGNPRVDLGKFEHARQEMNINLCGIEAHLLRHRDPTHPDVIGVFASKVQNPAPLQLVFANRAAQGYMGSQQKCHSSLTGAGRRRQGVTESALHQSINEVVRRDKTIKKFGA